MYIPDDKLEEVRAASDVVDVISDYVRLKKRGTNFFGLCPFHHEKSPSFSVNPGMGIFKCFGCGAGGNVFQFVMRVESLGFVEAVRMLAERAGIPLPEQEEQQEEASEIESIYHALRFAARFYYQQLTQTEAGKPALDYLQHRGFSPKSIKQFGLGFAPDRWDSLLQEAEQQHIEPHNLEKAGLVLPRKDGNGYYDRFRGRVVFPIFSHVGKVLGFGGRILTKDPKQPKYINSPETRVYNKSRVLYGLYQGRQAIRKSEEVILVEGYTDVMALHQTGVANVVASSGTALTINQVKLLGRYAKRVLLLYDADAAGTGAALRGIDLILEQGLSAYAVALPGGDDPDSYVFENGGEAFQDFVRKHRQDFVAFKYGLARKNGDLDTPEGEASAMHDILASVARIPDTLMQETYLRKASEVLGIPDIQLRGVISKLNKAEKRRSDRIARRIPEPEIQPPSGSPAQEVYTPEASPKPSTSPPLPQEKILLRLMLEHGAPMVEFILGHMALDEFTEGPSRKIASEFMQMYEDDAIVTNRFVDGSYEAPIQSLAAEVLVDRYEPSENWELMQNIPVPRINEDPKKAATSAMVILKTLRVDRAIQTLHRKEFTVAADSDDHRQLQTEIMQLHTLRQRIQRREFLEWSSL